MLSANFEYILLIYFIYTKGFGNMNEGFGNMNGERITLQNIKGIGDKISEKILNSIGGEEELQKIVDNVDVEKISECCADGTPYAGNISQRHKKEVILKNRLEQGQYRHFSKRFSFRGQKTAGKKTSGQYGHKTRDRKSCPGKGKP